MTATQKSGISRGVVVLVILLVVVPVGVAYVMNTNYQNYTSTHSYTDTAYDTLSTNYQNYMSTHSYSDSEYSDLQDIIDLNKTIEYKDQHSINHPEGYFYYWNITNIGFAGYINITIHSSTTTIPYAEVEYTCEGTTWELRQTFDDILGSAIFPVLPAPLVKVSIGSSLLESATHVVSIVYQY